MIALLLELIIQIFVEGLFEASSQGLSKKSWFPKVINNFLAGVVYFGLGAISGLVVTVFFPNRFAHIYLFPGMSLLVIPLLAALTLVGIGALRRWQGKQRVRLDRFAFAYLFAFGMALARFVFVL